MLRLGDGKDLSNPWWVFIQINKSSQKDNGDDQVKVSKTFCVGMVIDELKGFDLGENL